MQAMRKFFLLIALLFFLLLSICACGESRICREENTISEADISMDIEDEIDIEAQKVQPTIKADYFEVTITRNDFSTYQSDGSLRLQLYGDLAQVSANTESANRINEVLMQSYEDWIPMMEEFQKEEWAEEEIENWNQCMIGPLRNTWSTEEAYQDDYCISFREVWDSYYGMMLSHTEFYGKTFDKRTGESITLQQLLGYCYEPVLHDFGYIHASTAMNNGSWNTEELNFYIASNGEIVLQLPPTWNMVRWGDEIPMGIYITIENNEVVAGGREELLASCGHLWRNQTD